jgi:hypothetical protein
MTNTQREWFDRAIEIGTSGDQVFDILADWRTQNWELANQLEDAYRNLDFDKILELVNQLRNA